MVDLFRTLLDLNMPKGQFAVFGSAPLVVRGIIPLCGDIDVLCRGPVWALVQTLGERGYLQDFDVEIVSLADGRLTFGTRWAIGNFDTDELIDTAEMHEGLPFVQLRHVAAYKRVSDRPKDRAHLLAMQQQGYLGLLTQSLI